MDVISCPSLCRNFMQSEIETSGTFLINGLVVDVGEEQAEPEGSNASSVLSLFAPILCLMQIAVRFPEFLKLCPTFA